jgi:hypothetical protein
MTEGEWEGRGGVGGRFFVLGSLFSVLCSRFEREMMGTTNFTKDTNGGRGDGG